LPTEILLTDKVVNNTVNAFKELYTLQEFLREAIA
jgi:hypothetical protein